MQPVNKIQIILKQPERKIEQSAFAPPTSCNGYWFRSVFVDWRDYQGNYGFEEVRY